MRKLFFLIIVMVSVLQAQAVFYLPDSLSNLEDNKVWITTSRSTGPYEIFAGGNGRLQLCQIYRSNAGIGLSDGNGISSQATYKLEKKYSKLSFWLAPSTTSSNYYTLLTITADGKRLYDEPVFGYDAPRFVVLDVAGVETLKFKLVDAQVPVTFAKMQLWKEGEKVVEHPFQVEHPDRKVQLVEELLPYYMTGGIKAIRSDIMHDDDIYVPSHAWWKREDSISIARYQYKSGLQLASYEKLIGTPEDYAYFWLNKKYDKLSFIVGPRDNKSSNASVWLVVKGDKNKIIYEDIIRQSDLPRQVVLNVAGQNRIAIGCELRDCDLLGGMTFGVVDIFAYPKGDTSVPKEGEVNPNKELIAALPSPCALMSNIKPFSVRGKGDADAVRFTGESKYKTFSMGGVKFNEGLILTTGSTFLGDGIDSYMSFDLAREFDYISFYTGMLTKRRSLQDDRLLVYADDSLVLDTLVHCIWPNQYFEVPVHKCRILKFAKPGHNTNKDCYICVADIALYRGKPVKNNLFVHDQPECPDEADLIDLCGNPYFHYVGRYLSTLTNFDFNDCFIPGGSKRNFFQMKDGSQIYKGVMLEANVPLGFEDINIMDAAMMFMVGAGSAISATDFSAYTGVSAGGGLAGNLAILNLMNRQNGGQASVVAFNTYGEYKSCTFTIANKSEYWDDVDMVMNLGQRIDHPFKLNIFADHKLVGELWLTNKMEPVTMTVPLFNAQSLMFWLEPGPMRSGQFVLYDMTVSKAPCDVSAPEGYHPELATPDDPKSMLEQAAGLAEKALDKMNEVLGTTKQCWEVTYKEGKTTHTVYGWLTEEDVKGNIAEMQSDPQVSDVQYRPSDAQDEHACKELFNQSK